jgi:hypothetical protein
MVFFCGSVYFGQQVHKKDVYFFQSRSLAEPRLRNTGLEATIYWTTFLNRSISVGPGGIAFRPPPPPASSFQRCLVLIFQPHLMHIIVGLCKQLWFSFSLRFAVLKTHGFSSGTPEDGWIQPKHVVTWYCKIHKKLLHVDGTIKHCSIIDQYCNRMQGYKLIVVGSYTLWL